MDQAALQQFTQMMMSWVDRTAVIAAADLGLADHFGDGPRSADELAGHMKVDRAALARLLKVLTATGMVVHAGGGRYELTPMGQFLRTDVPGSQRSWCRALGGVMAPALVRGEVSVSTGGPSFEAAMGSPAWDWLRANPKMATIFNASMVEFAGMLGTPALMAYDWRGVKRLVDVGGGRGQLARSVLAANPHMTGVVYDQPGVVAEAAQAIAADGLSDRCQAMGGDFFTSVPAGADCYTLRFIIHDWNDAEALAILRTCRAAIVPGGRLLLFEVIMPDVDGPHLAKTVDWIMLTCITGRERTEAEYGGLLAEAGFRLDRVIASPTPMSVLEATPI